MTNENSKYQPILDAIKAIREDKADPTLVGYHIYIDLEYAIWLEGRARIRGIEPGAFIALLIARKRYDHG